MEEAPENGKESSHSAHAKAMNEWISGFCHSAVDVFSLLGCYVAYVDSWLPTFWDNTLLPSSGVKQPKTKYKKTLW